MISSATLVALLAVVFLTGRYVESISAYLWFLAFSGCGVAWLARSHERAADEALTRHSRSLMQYQYRESTVESVEWFNIILEKTFNRCHTNFGEYMRATLDPWLEYYKPASVSSFKFSRFEIGKKAPRFRSITVHRLASTPDASNFDTFQIDCDLEFYCDLYAVATAKLGFVPVPISLKDLRIIGPVRLIMTVDPYWYVMVCKVSFLGKPDIDVTIKPLKGLDLMGVPALSSWLRNMIVDGIANTMAWPLCYVYDARDWVVPDEAMLQRKRLKIVVCGGRNLEPKNLDGSSDPYVIVRVGGEDGTSFRTRTIPGTLNPIFSESFVFYVTDIRAVQIELSVFDEDRFLKNSPMGTAVIGLKAEVDRAAAIAAAEAAPAPSLDALRDAEESSDAVSTPAGKGPAAAASASAGASAASTPTAAAAAAAAAASAAPVSNAPAAGNKALPDGTNLLSIRKWVPLEKANSGELQIFLELEAAPSETPQPGTLRIELKNAEDLHLTRSLVIGKKPSCSPYVSFRVGDQTAQSSLRKNNRAIWDESFELRVADVRTQFLVIAVFEKEMLARDSPIGDAVFPLDDLVRDMTGAPKLIKLHNVDTGRLRIRFEFTPDAGVVIESRPTPGSAAAGAAGAGVGASGAGAGAVAGAASAAGSMGESSKRESMSAAEARARAGSLMGAHEILDAHVDIQERFGVLEKRSNVWHSWNPRAMLMTADGSLYYFEGNVDRATAAANLKDARGQIDLRTATISKEDALTKSMNEDRKGRFFTITDARKTFYLCAANPADRAEWMESLRVTIEKLGASSGNASRADSAVVVA